MHSTGFILAIFLLFVKPIEHIFDTNFVWFPGPGALRIPRKILGGSRMSRLHREGCPIYPHRVGSSKLRIDSTYRKSSRERLSVNYSKVMWGGGGGG